MTVDELNVRLTADIGNLTQRLNQAERELEELGNTSEQATSRATAGFDALKGAISALGIGAALKEVVTAAGELEQNMGGSSAVFKEYATTLQQYAAQAYQTMGLSQSQYLATANKMGALFQGSGFSIAESVDLTSAAMQRAADVASIMGIDVSSAMEAVAGAAKGNFTMMDNLGVAINDTTLQIYAQEKGLGKLETTQQKVNAAMMMFMETSEYAAGNYARENATFAGSLQTFKAELQNAAAEIGTGLLPAAVQGIQALTTVFSDLTPFITAVATGLGVVGEAFELLENPVMRSVVYAGAATVAINKLTMAVGSSASGLILLGTLLSFVLGKYMQAQEVADETVSTGLDGISDSAEEAAAGIDKTKKSTEELKETAKSLMAPFDEITKLSGNTKTQLIDEGEAENIEGATAALTEYKGEAVSFEPPDLTPKFDWERLKADAESLKNDIVAVFTGTETESYQALSRLNDRISELFGEEWTDFWQGVGQDIFDAFYEFGSKKSYDAIYELNEKIKSVPFLDTFQEIGMNLGATLSEIVEGIKKLFDGDFEGASEHFAAAKLGAAKTTKAILNETPLGGMTGAVGFLAEGAADLVIEDNEQKQQRERENNDTLEQMERTIQGYIAGGMSADAALARTKTEFYDNSDMFGGQFVEWYNDLPQELRFEDKVDNWAAEFAQSGTINGNNIAAPVTATDIYSLLGGMPQSGPQYIKIDVKVDEDVLGSAYASYSDGQIEVTNGK